MRSALLAVAALGLAAAAPAPAFHIGVVGAPPGPCAPPPPSAPAGERAYFSLLNQRLGRPVQACPVANLAEGAAALAAGKLDMTVLDPASYAPVKGKVRSTMTVRPEGGLPRTAVLLAVKAGHDGTPQALKDHVIAFGGSGPTALAAPRRVLSEQGYSGRELVATDEIAAVAALRAGKADAVALSAEAWQRQCQGSSPKIQPCADLKLVWRARPQAERAFAVRLDMPDPVRYRLLGVHLAMHMEDKPAFAWAASQLSANAADFEPAESRALEAAQLQ